MGKELSQSQYVRTGLRADDASRPKRSLGRGMGKGYGQLGKANARAKDFQHGLEPTREGREAWAAKNLPGENHYVVTAARLRLVNQGKPETPENVREYLRGRGWLREQNS